MLCVHDPGTTFGKNFDLKIRRGSGKNIPMSAAPMTL